jgi:hypothetical protein
MLKSPQLTTAAIAATILSLAATPAIARQADAPLHPAQTAGSVAPHAQHWTQPRTDAIGVRPATQPTATTPTPAVPLTRSAPTTSGPDWLLIAIGSTAILALLLSVALLPTRWLRAHPFRARQV